MFKNYITIAYRNLIKQPGFSFINIIGLAIGMACSILILLHIEFELSYDSFHPNIDNLYKVVEEQVYSDHVFSVMVTPGPLAPYLAENYPEVKHATRVTEAPRLLFKYKDKSFYESSAILADSSFLMMFSYELIMGDANTSLSDPNSIILSEELVTKYFGDGNPIGETITIENGMDFTVTGVIKNPPKNTHLTFNAIIPFKFLEKIGRYSDDWGNNSIYTYLETKPNTDLMNLRTKIKDEIKNHNEGSVTNLHLQRVADIHLYPLFEGDPNPGSIRYIYIFGAIALFILLIACINFINLTTAKASNRAKEVGLRKVIGAQRRDIVKQFFGESIILAFLSLFLAIILVYVIVPEYNTFIEKELSFNIFSDNQLFIGILIIALFTGIISGSYPALFLSSFQPIKVMRGTIMKGAKGTLFRKVLVVFQFSLSIILIISTLVITKQLDYIHNKNVGYQKDNIIYFRLSQETTKNYQTFKDRLANNTDIKGVTRSRFLPSSIGSSSSSVSWDGKNEEDIYLVSFTMVGYDFLNTTGIKLLEGRDYSEEFPTDTNGIIFNKEMISIMNMDDPIGKTVTIWGEERHIVGVTDNFHFIPLQYGMKPLMIFPNKWLNDGYGIISIKGGAINNAIDNIEETWAEVYPDYPFEYHFFEKQFEQLYKSEEKMAGIFGAFSILGIIISALGLFGLASFMVTQQRKEIGIRKVLGASISNIVYKLSIEFIKWVIIANIIAWPVAYYVMDSWLNSFAFHTELPFMMFILSAVLAILIAFVTVSYQTFRAALENPVDTIKFE